MQANMRDFEERYNQGITKTAIGIYIIREAGREMKHTDDMIETSVCVLCNLLADNINISRETVYNDAHLAYNNLPSHYIIKLRDSGILEQFLNELVNANILKRLDN